MKYIIYLIKVMNVKVYNLDSWISEDNKYLNLRFSNISKVGMMNIIKE